MSKKPNVVAAITDSATDLIQKVATPASRAGASVERVGRMIKAGVAPEVIALQMTMNSPKGVNYTPDKIVAYGELYEDSKTKAPITAKQTRSLIEDQHAQRNADDDLAEGQPAQRKKAQLSAGQKSPMALGFVKSERAS